MLYYRVQKRKSKLHGSTVLFFYIVLLWLSWIVCEIPFDFFHSATRYIPEVLSSRETLELSFPPSETKSEETSPSFVEPAVGVVTSPFGERWGRNHEGIDIGGAHASHIKAASSGIVLVAQWVDGYGNYIELDHGNGFKTAYGHCNDLLVAPGDLVSSGQLIATMGNTGNSTGTHLHFEILLNGEPQNPLNYVVY